MAKLRHVQTSLMSGEVYVVLFVVALLVLVGYHHKTADFQQQLEQARQDAAALRERARELRRQVAARRTDRVERPPLIVLSEVSRRFRFASGDATLSQQFERALRRQVVPLLEREARRARCDRVEVVGHTDGVPLGVARRSNLDRHLMEAMGSMAGPKRPLSAGDNAGLGMMRAVAVMRFLRQEQARGRLDMIRQILPYSAAQAIAPGDRVAEDDRRPVAARRRIELRLRRNHGGM